MQVSYTPTNRTTQLCFESFWYHIMFLKLETCVGFSTQLNSSLLTHGSPMAKRNIVHKNKSNDQSE